MTDIPPTDLVKIPRYIRTDFPTEGTDSIKIYAGVKIEKALGELMEDMTLYHGVRLSQVIRAAYAQGLKDGARGVFDSIDSLKETISYRNPGKPPKKIAKKAALKRKLAK